MTADKGTITNTEAETLAVILDNAGRAMATARNWRGEFAWTEAAQSAAWKEILAGFYEIIPLSSPVTL